MSFMSQAFSFKPFDIKGALTDTVYRDVELVQPMPAGWPLSSTMRARYTFKRRAHSFIVECMVHSAAVATCVEKEFSTWQRAYEFIEAAVNVIDPNQIVRDAKYPYYDANKMVRTINFLEDIAKQGRVVTYMELEIMAGIHRSGEARDVLTNLAHGSWLKYGFLLSALVVNAETHKPSSGFFSMASQFWKEANVSEEDMWAREVRKIWSYYLGGVSLMCSNVV